ncbi:MAG: succinylglutamate desuccinylase/aspartoacylase family protein, partial [Chthoniobacterales bacterium]
AGNDEVAKNSKAIAIAFGLPYVLTISKPVQAAKGLSSYAAAAEKAVPAVLAEAGGVGQMQEEAVELLANGVVNVMQHLGMFAGAKFQIPGSKSQANSKLKTKKTEHSAVATQERSAAGAASTTLLRKFEWLYTKHSGMWYPKVAAGEIVNKGQEIGRVADLFGDTFGKR